MKYKVLCRIEMIVLPKKIQKLTILMSFNFIQSSPSAMSASLALLNRIKSLENQKKRTNQITSTAIKVAAAAANSAAISSGQIYANPPSNVNNQNMNNSYRLANSAQKHSQNGLTVYEQIEANRSPSPMQSPSQNRRNVGKFERFFTCFTI